MLIEQWQVSKLKPYTHNARKIPQIAIDKVAASLKTYGFRQPIVADEQGVIIAGHTRWYAAQSLGMDSVPVHVAKGLTKQQAQAYRLMDNRSHQESEWDTDILSTDLADLASAGYDLSLTGFDAYELDELLFAQESDSDTEDGDKQPIAYPIFSQESIIAEAFSVFRERGFPYPSADMFEHMIELNKLAMLERDALPTSNAGYSIADCYHTHRFAAAAYKMRSPVEGFEDDKALKKVLKMELEQNGRLEYKKLGFMSLVNGVQACSNFRPAYARYIYETYAKKDAVVFDSSTGYGGRLIGFLASHAGHYIGVDPNKPTYEANKRIKAALGAHKEVTLYNSAIEDLDASKHANSCDLAFTSPPYFIKEQYSSDDTQSCVRYTNYDAWRDGFLKPMLAKQMQVLRKGGKNIVNIEDVTVDSKTYPLVKDTISISKALGFNYERIDKFPLPNRTRLVNGEVITSEASESVIVLSK